jgi:SpoVK/Ycf46/Vps4 family AAA+-type ATPase
MMARADLLIDLVRSARRGDQDDLRRDVEALIAEEDAKQHHLVADRLRQALRANGRALEKPLSAPDVPAGLQIQTPLTTLDDLVLPASVVATCLEVVEEQRRIELLRAHGLEPRHRMLVVGPPGTGKTSLAEGMAEALLLPLVILRYEMVIGSFLGETGARLAQLFEWARTRRCVLFFDEFDAIAKERGDVHETGEVKRVVSSLLMLIDEMPSHVVVIAASNHPELLDRAVDRRFEVKLDLPAPTPSARTEWWSHFLRRFDDKPRASAKTLAERTPVKNFAELDDLGMDIRRQLVLNVGASPDRVYKDRIDKWRKRRAASA